MSGGMGREWRTDHDRAIEALQPGKPAATDRLHLTSPNHSFTLDLVVLVSAHPSQRWLYRAVEKRLREEFAKLEVEVNEEKSRRVNLKRGDRFNFLGFDFWRVRSRADRWMPLIRPQLKKRTALLRQLKVVFRSLRSQPIRNVIEIINPILRGWDRYFSIGHASQCFSFVSN